MKKFAVFSGFLGSGKTTTMMTLTKYFTEKYGKAAMISNDLGEQSLADNKLANLAGCNATELVGDCICYQTENLVSRLDELFDDRCELVISDIPGFGVGALDHVYHTLQNKYTDRYTLAPFTVLTEPETVRQLMNNNSGDMAYILNTQLLEADVIVLNKCDTLSESEEKELIKWLSDTYTDAKVIGISAVTGYGIDALAIALKDYTASMRLPDIGYGGADFMAAMGKLSEYYIQYYGTVCCDDFDGNEYISDMAEKVRVTVNAKGYDIPHLKILAWEPEGDYGKADFLGVDRVLEVSKKFEKPCTELAVMINGSAVCPRDVLDEIVTNAVETVSEEYNLTLMIFKKECFGMGN